ncbi:2-amino-4-hydroxy-6-hydroxymethyldihydropteridine diphosphokinase [Zymobacter palmae]|uniref:2-amino-4-hydroxy-6-hydroxymethyldihydropteridine diphosphokinase n=1 Tax=Zymobacter palmae TaxID=33074 RepID=A0A348HGR6_9GAMM|nr:2-amino-4-hydroxy-6-hydroxymethyldihydropteridine diphosphokinase [Zymobacter palmae]BBG30818.1 hypothetical protein ZBT109_2074 [Zymobacter palmae]
MTLAVLGIGSNIGREHNIRTALDALSTALGPLALSPIVESDPVGYDSTSRFYNIVVGVETDQKFQEVKALCKRLERQSGRRTDEPRFSPKTLDIDVLLWGDEVTSGDQHPILPHPDIERFAHVLCPLALLYPDATHPVERVSYKALWEQRKADLPVLTVLPPSVLTHPAV